MKQVQCCTCLPRTALITERDEKLTKVHVSFMDGGGESLWAREIEGDLFALDNLPFFAFGLNAEDVVLAPKIGRMREVRSVVRPSGHRTLRILFDEDVPKTEQKLYLDRLRELGAAFERGTKRFVAVDVPPEGQYDAIVEVLARCERAGELTFETCEARVPGSFDDVHER